MEMAVTANRGRFEVLDSFRGICALFVVVFHMRLAGSFTELQFFRHSEHFVEFFFILSGFVLTHGYRSRRDLNFFAFMQTRWFRLYPLHIFMLLFFIFIELAKLMAYRYGGLSFTHIPFTGASSVYEFLPNALLIQSWIPKFEHLSFNYPSWSISVEFYVYAIFFITISFFNRYRVFVWLCLAFLSFFLLIQSSHFFTLQSLKGIFCFFLGSLIYKAYLKLERKVNISSFYATLIEVTLLVYTVYFVAYETHYQNLLTPFLFSVVILFFSFESGHVSGFLRKGVFQWLGKLSYSIYMIHAAVLFFALSIAIILQKFLDKPVAPMMNSIRFIDSGNPYVNNLICFLILGSVILLSEVTYRYIEVQGIKLGRTMRKK